MEQNRSKYTYELTRSDGKDTFGGNRRVIIGERHLEVELSVLPNRLHCHSKRDPTPFRPGMIHFHVFKSVVPLGRVTGPAYL